MTRRNLRYSLLAAMLAGISVAFCRVVGASNPCTPNWQPAPVPWQISPSVWINDPPSRVYCFSPSGVHIVVEVNAQNFGATPGRVDYWDANQCENPGAPPVVDVTPTIVDTSWFIYSDGSHSATPTAGQGLTADFTVFHAGFIDIRFNVVGHIAARSQYPPNAEWDGVDQAVCIVYVRPEIKEPDGDPATDNHYYFTYSPGASWPNGHCTIEPVGDGCDSDPWWLEWSYPDIPGCIKSQALGDPPYTNPTLWYDRLPGWNGLFGNKTLSVVQQPSGCSHSRTIQLFFSVGDDAGQDAAVNHPSDYTAGGATGVTPNWFYYWIQTTANYQHPGFLAWSSPYIGYTDYIGGAWRHYLCYPANNSFTCPHEPFANVTFTGVDLFAFVARHEHRHVTLASTYWPNGKGTGQGQWPAQPADSDQGEWDGLPDYAEAALGGTWQNRRNGGPFDPNMINTDLDTEFDGHDYVYSTQYPWTLGLADASDWSVGGHQWYQ